MISYKRNIQGEDIELKLIEITPDAVSLDPSNPRISYSMRQLGVNERTEAACALILTSQEETEALKRSILLSGGVQEPIYIRASHVVAEGNRRVVALRAAREERPSDARLQRLPAWVIPADTSEEVVQDLLNEIHLGSVRGWAPYEKALQMRALRDGALVTDEIAERYRMTSREVKQHIAAVELMDAEFFPIVDAPTDPEHRAKYSYFLEFVKNGRIRKACDRYPNLPKRFARWVKDAKIDTGVRVRRLPRILDSEKATHLLEVIGAKAAEDYLAKRDPTELELYGIIERARLRISAMTVEELMELADCTKRMEILRALAAEIQRVELAISRLRNAE